MKLEDITQRHALLAVVALLTLAIGAGGVAMATTTTLSGDGTDLVDPFAGNDGDHIEYSLSSDGTDFSSDNTEDVYMNVTYDGVEHARNSTTNIDQTKSSITLNLSHADFDTVPGKPNSNTTVNVSAWGEDSNGDVATSVTEFQVDLKFDDSRNVMYLESGTDNYANGVNEKDREVGLFDSVVGSLSSVASTLNPFSEDTSDDGERDFDVASVEDSRNISGDQTTLHMHLADDDLNAAFSEKADAYDESGEPVLGLAVEVTDSDDNTELVPVYRDSNDGEYTSTNETYATYDGDEIVVELDDDYSDDSEVDVHAGSYNAFDEDLDYSLSDVQDTYGDELDGSQIRGEFGILTWMKTYIPGISAGLSIAGLLVIGLRRRRTIE